MIKKIEYATKYNILGLFLLIVFRLTMLSPFKLDRLSSDILKKSRCNALIFPINLKVVSQKI